MNRIARRRVYLLLSLGFLLSRLIYVLIGVRFDLRPLSWFWQYLDVPILRGDLLRGCFYMHGQPPLFNLFLGVVLKLFPVHYPVAFHFAYIAFGLALCLAIYEVLNLAGCPGSWALLFSLLYVVCPPAVLYENWLFYSYPVSVLLVVACLALAGYAKSGGGLWLVLHFLCLTALCLTRSMFHAAFFLVCLVLVRVVGRSGWKKVLMVGLPGLLVALLPYVKNAALYGVPASSSWLGMNLWRLVSSHLSEEEVKGLAAAEEIPKVCVVNQFSALSEYPPEFRSVPPRFRGLKVLSEPVKEWGEPNFNHYGYIGLANAYRRGALKVIKWDAKRYICAVVDAWLEYFLPSTSTGFLLSKSRIPRPWWWLSSLRMRVWVDAGAVYGRVLGVPRSRMYPLTSLLFIPGAMLLGACTTLSAVRQRKGNRVRFAVCAFSLLAVVYVAAVGNMIEWGENSRFRAMTDPLLYILVVFSARSLAVRLCDVLHRYRHV